MLTLAAGIADTILSNVDAWYEGVITYEAFNERQIIAGRGRGIRSGPDGRRHHR
jgi:hypothetical protein